ncbi:MAG: acetyl-coenzyme A synthetase, partial [Acidobacteria bacterium]|nr:acetyl-coenzyme A synthetase [Acidobacteriota bacterium]
MIPVKPKIAESAHVASLEAYQDLYRRSIEDPDGFWGEAAKSLDWFHPPAATGTWDYHEVEVTWFPAGRLNACYNCVDRHV